MELPSLPPIGETLSQEYWLALLDAAVYSAENSGTRAWRDSTMPQGILGAGVDMAVLEDASGQRCVVENFARELDLNAAGLNGWDGGGSINADMWAFIWLIAQDAGNWRVASQWAFLASASYTTPNVPSGWTHKRLISAARIESDGSGGWGLAPFRHSGDRYEYSGRRLVAAYSGVRTKAAQTLSSAVPPLANLAHVALISEAATGTLEIAAHTTGASNSMHSAWSYANKRGEDAGPIHCPNQTIDTAVTTTGGGTGSLYVTGYEWPEGAKP